ncbi:MAG: sigma-70 family RNA polymerase sigma factor [Candidatus Omnitrophota bacterium]|nr:sigma-70 family RNA polymerase sigma factor [Candidatus Omnitrophota bacterium]
MDFAEHPSLSSDELVQNCIKKDKRAWDIFVERYSKVVFWAIRNRLKRFGYNFDEGDIEDIHQDVFISLWSDNKLAQIKDKDRVAGWLAMVAGNAAIDYFKKMKRQSPPNSLSIYEEIYKSGDGGDKTLEDVLPSQDAGPGKRAHLNDIFELVNSAIDSLKPKEKIVVRLNLLHGMKHRDIAEALKMPVNTVSTTIARAKEDLKVKLRRKGIKDL